MVSIHVAYSIYAIYMVSIYCIWYLNMYRRAYRGSKHITRRGKVKRERVDEMRGRGDERP
jgi:hypothetical protein